jgi:hypothetical protein
VLRLTLLVGALLGTSTVAQAQEPGSELAVSLLTVDAGSLVYELFGHNGIRIRDTRPGGQDRVYHWGLFDFDSPGFIRNFLKGRMLYMMGSIDTERFVTAYRQDNRTVHEQPLNLAPAQRSALLQFVLWNELPQNRSYRYDYYRDNCSTRVRDALDRVLGGALRNALQARPDHTYRYHTRVLTYQDKPLYTGLMLAMGANIDEPITAWDEGFIPMELRKQISSVLVSGSVGPAPLVQGDFVLFQANRPQPPDTPPNLMHLYLIIGFLLAGLMLVLGSLRAPAAHIGFGVIAGIWSLVIGLVGTIMMLLWAFTDHTVTYRNENLMQANVLSLFLLGALIAMALGSAWGRRAGARVSLVIAGLATVGLVMQVLPGLDQSNGEMIALLLPPHTAIAWVLAGRIRFRSLRAAPAPESA